MPKRGWVAALLAVAAAIAVAGAFWTRPATADETVAVAVTDTPLFLVTADPMVVHEGTIRFEVTNYGEFLPHNVVIVATDLPPDGLPVIMDPQSPLYLFVDEGQLDVVDKTEQLLVGQSQTLEVFLPAGNYVLFCNDQKGHYLAGEYTGFTVLPPPPTATPQATATPKDPGADTDGDTIPNGEDPNDDNDACTDVQELGEDPSLGGLRDPHNFWDVFDVPAGAGLTRDENVTAQDIFAVIGRFNATDAGPGDFDRNSDPLTTPNQVVVGEHRANYHPAYDRGGVTGQYAWDLAPPDGSVAALEIFAVIAQFGHGCA